jgi:ribulose bisphosphate carboxylase small subunit
MNNPLAQKAQYYLNESHRLSEELKNETQYSELLENILVGFVERGILSEEQLDFLMNEGQSPAGEAEDDMRRGSPYWRRAQAFNDMKAQKAEEERAEKERAKEEQTGSEYEKEKLEAQRRTLAAHYGMTPEETEEFVRTGKKPSRLAEPDSEN